METAVARKRVFGKSYILVESNERYDWHYKHELSRPIGVDVVLVSDRIQTVEK